MYMWYTTVCTCTVTVHLCTIYSRDCTCKFSCKYCSLHKMHHTDRIILRKSLYHCKEAKYP